MTVKSKMKLALTGRKKYTVTRIGEGSYVNGRWVEGTESTFEVIGHEQPSGPKEIQMLPDSFRSKDVRWFFSNADLRTVQEGSGLEPDKITVDGIKFEVHKRYTYQMGPMNHNEYVIVREEQSAGGTS